jgi:ABC-type polysaccharide/polyol phosphate export permease
LSSLQLLITNSVPAERAGTVTLVRDLVIGLKDAGHSPVLYSPETGDVAGEIRDRRRAGGLRSGIGSGHAGYRVWQPARRDGRRARTVLIRDPSYKGRRYHAVRVHMSPRRERGSIRTGGFSAIRHDLEALVRSRYVIQNLVATQLKLRYHRTVLGICWTLLNPLLLLGVQAIAFSQILRIDIRTYALYLLSGLILWHFFSNAIDQSSRTLISNEGLIRVVPTPKFVFPLSDVIVSLVHSGFALLAFFVLVPVFGGSFHRQLVLLPAGILLLAMFTFGLALVTMTLMTMFRDFAHIIGVLMTAWYFASPIIYPPDLISRFRFLLQGNPLSYYLEFFHDALSPMRALTDAPGTLEAVWPSGMTWIVATACSVSSLAIGYWTYKRFEDEYIFHL